MRQSLIFCINCKIEGHTAGSTKCTKGLEIISKRKDAKEKAASLGAVRSARIAAVRDGVSYAAATTPRPAPSFSGANVNTNQRRNDFVAGALGQAMAVSEDCITYFGKSLIDIISDIREFTPEFIRLRDTQGRLGAVLELVLHIFGL